MKEVMKLGLKVKIIPEASWEMNIAGEITIVRTTSVEQIAVVRISIAKPIEYVQISTIESIGFVQASTIESLSISFSFSVNRSIVVNKGGYVAMKGAKRTAEGAEKTVEGVDRWIAEVMATGDDRDGGNDNRR
ncbi:hypothetical protein LOK49_LG11G01330 [Camellia lanceoleosa]|uniref:Uncharacterized protein n=1 Tax=Camellia lanceoleosa TaxID=1840588 RepID=A0ACC0G421_9ERIC|nr:hypothetical protein LOK49_LG11G01330 [Camellia lanceoleosa]